MNDNYNPCLLECPEHIRGLCCYHSIWINGKNQILKDMPCEYLDTETKLCTVYDKRFEMDVPCLDVKTAIMFGALPIGCPYTKDIPYYRGKEL